MIKTLFVGLWVCAVTLGSAYYGMSMNGGAHHDPNKPAPVELLKLRPITVPVVNEAGVEGYLLAVIGYNIDRKKLTDPATMVEPILQDESFRMLYGVDSGKYKKPRKSDLDEISKSLVEGVNKRFGVELAKDVLIEELSYIPKEKARSGRGG